MTPVHPKSRRGLRLRERPAPVHGQLALRVRPPKSQTAPLDASAIARTGHVTTKRVGAPAQLQLLDKPYVTPPGPQHLAAPDPLRAAFDSLSPVTTRANLRLLPKNRDAWLGVWDVVNTAPDGIDASYFILERDIYGMAFLGGLLKKAREGHRVRLLVDSAGDWLRMKGFTMPTRGGDYLQELVAHGAQVRIYNPMHLKIFNLLMGTAKGFDRIANNHDKLVRSRTKAQTGGRNLATDYLSHPDDCDERVYRDTCVHIESEATSLEMERAFEREFYQDDVTFQQFPDLLGNWVKRDGELLGAYLMMDSWVNGEPKLTASELERLKTDKPFRKEVAERVVDRACERFAEVDYTTTPGWRTKRSMRVRARQLCRLAHLHGGYPAFAAAKTPHENVEVKVLDRQSAAVKGGADHLTHAIRTAAYSAQKRIRIHNPYVTLSEPAIRALESAGRRGVKIELFTNSPDSSDNRVTQGFFLEDWPRLLARVPNLRIFVAGKGRKQHAKSIEVDDRMTFVKSYNLDLLSERVNSELGIVAWSESFAKDAGAAFEADQADPMQGVVEYTIKRAPNGRPLTDDDGEPIVEFGAKDHIAPKVWRSYKFWRWAIRMLRTTPALDQHQRPSLEV